MRWMLRFFNKVVEGDCPRLVDLPTGAAKTDVAVIWVIALGWYGGHRQHPVPRRLVWIVNRRVLVQQVFTLVDLLKRELLKHESKDDGLRELRQGLAQLSGDPADIFRVAQLRGQLLDDREWSLAPAVPQLIVGTVDQIGSRLFFQGYGLGKWSRPMQAGLLAVDSWICIDEAHLVPAFILTLRQSLTFIASSKLPEAIAGALQRLPFWLTELSATPSLPAPPSEQIFCLDETDEDDPSLKDRLLAARTRQVKVHWLGKDEKLDGVITKAALDDTSRAIAIFVQTPATAQKISKALSKPNLDRVLTITGRLRGYERDRLGKNPIFNRFRSRGETEGVGDQIFLVGTAAAEVGLDADADAIYCDFAPLPTLLQRLGRLDRRGVVSSRSRDGEASAPTMTIFAEWSETNQDIERRILELASSMAAEKVEAGPSILVGNHWITATAKANNKQEVIDLDSDETEDTKSAESKESDDKKGIEPDSIVSAATRSILVGRRQARRSARPPSRWLKCRIASVTSGPTAVPPLTRAIIEHWTATTNPRSAFLPVHPFLYGILPSEDGTPLVSVAFRLEMDALKCRAPESDESVTEDQSVAEQIRNILDEFTPRRSEFHQIPITAIRDWLYSSTDPVASFDGDEWTISATKDNRPRLQPGSVLILPTLAEGINFLEDPKKPATWDVLNGVSEQSSPYLRKIVEAKAGDHKLDSNGDGAFSTVSPKEFVDNGTAPKTDVLIDEQKWKRHSQQRLNIGSTTFRFEYYKKARQFPGRLLLDEHLIRAEREAARLSDAIAPGNKFLHRLFSSSGKAHDVGKRNPKWQRSMGNGDMTNPVAKPLIEKPLQTHGFRHEWQSLIDISQPLQASPNINAEADEALWTQLWHHLIATHHGHLRPWLRECVLEIHPISKQKQSRLRLQCAEGFARLQKTIGPWRLAYLEAILKAADVAASQISNEETTDEQ